jgi:hypothetical protein
MEPTTDWKRQPETERIAGERRQDRRYDLQLDMRWKLIRRRKVLETGTGRTVNVSSGGICFEAERNLPAGLDVELSLSWPVMLHKVAPLQLAVSGRIVRSEGGLTAIRMIQHEFRTLAQPAENRKEPQNVPRPPINFIRNFATLNSAGRARQD